MEPNLIILSFPTVGDSTLTASPAATYSFFSRAYDAPLEPRASEQDVVMNQNGTFIYNYDNGPAPYEWKPFALVFDDRFAGRLGGAMATQQWANFRKLWEHFGSLQLGAPEGIYTVMFPSQKLERRLIQFPHSVGDKLEFEVTIQLREA